jgi:hypothetical protein
VPKEPDEAIKACARSECGVHETNVEYVYKGWTQEIKSGNPRNCCGSCNRNGRCHAWKWIDWVDKYEGPSCVLMGGAPTEKVTKDGITSGMPIKEAQKAAWAAAKDAISEIPS